MGIRCIPLQIFFSFTKKVQVILLQTLFFMNPKVKSIGGILIGVAVFAGTLFIASWAISKGWESGQK